MNRTLYIQRHDTRELTIYVYGRIMVHVYDDRPDAPVVQDWNGPWLGLAMLSPAEMEKRNRQLFDLGV